MSLSRHSSSFALTSSNRGSEKDSDRLPEKSSIGEISSRISSRPLGVGSSWRARQSGPPTSQANESVCRARRFGTSSGPRSLAKETRFGLPAVDLDMLVTAKIRPFEDKHCVDTRLIARIRPFAERPEPRVYWSWMLVVDGQDIAVPLGISPGQTVFRARPLGHGVVRLDPGQHKVGSANK